MVKKLIGILVCALLYVLPAYAGEKNISEEIRGNVSADILVDGKGDIWMAYFDTKGGIHVRNETRQQEVLMKEAGEQSSRGVAFAVQGEHIFVVWREKISGSRKKLILRASHDGGKTLSDPVVLDDSTTEALSRMKIGATPKGEVYVAWLGERRTKSSDYNIYEAFSTDFGKTFTKPINLTEGYTHSIYPSILVDEENAYAFSYSERDKKRYMVFRRTTDDKNGWSDPLEIKEIGTVTFFIEPIKVGKRLHVFWFNTYGSEGIPVVEGAYSDDGGKTWTCRAFEDTKGFDVGSFRVAYNQTGQIYLALAGKWDEKEKSRVYVLASEDNGTAWGKLMPVRHNLNDDTTAKNPVIVAGDGAEVVVVWEDYRNIRSNLYQQHSKDGGKTWQEKDVPLEEPGRFNTALWQHSNSIVRLKDRYYVLSARSKDDLLSRELLLLTDFTLSERGVK